MQRLLVPKFYHSRKDSNFLQGLIYIGEKKEIDEKYFYETPLLGRKLSEYRVGKNNARPKSFHPRELDWSFPDKYYQSIGFTVYNFSFRFKNAPNSIRALLNPQNNLINVENGLEQAENNLTEELFFFRLKKPSKTK